MAPLDEQIAATAMLKEATRADIAADARSCSELEFDQALRELDEQGGLVRLLPALNESFLQPFLVRLAYRHSMEARAAIVILAIHRHRLQTGHWPETLVDIDPSILRVEPIDGLSGLPFGYAIVDGAPELWAAGPDRDDDGGEALPPVSGDEDSPVASRQREWFTLNEWDALSDEERAVYDGDRIIFPPAPPIEDEE